MTVPALGPGPSLDGPEGMAKFWPLPCDKPLIYYIVEDFLTLFYLARESNDLTGPNLFIVYEVPIPCKIALCSHEKAGWLSM